MADVQLRGGKEGLSRRTLPLSNGALASEAGREMTLGIHPEHLTAAGSSEGVVQLNVEFIEQLGADPLVHGQLGHDRTNVTLRMAGSTLVNAGDVLPLVAEPGSLHLFDRENGNRLQES